jgi:hypothetical protein
MSMRIICAQLVGFAVLLAALLAMPQAAMAHPGHTHGIHVSAAHAHTTHVQTADAGERIADGSGTSQANPDTRAEQSLTAATHGATGEAADLPCSLGCCTQNSCATCFSLVAPTPLLMQPPALSIKMSLAANPQPPGIDGRSLHRPPRSFA